MKTEMQKDLEEGLKESIGLDVEMLMGVVNKQHLKFECEFIREDKTIRTVIEITQREVL